MNSGIIQLLVLAGVAVFLILKLRSVLGSRDGFEKPLARDEQRAVAPQRRSPDLSVVEGGLDRDIVDHVPSGSPAADALARMKAAEPGFRVGEFLQGAKGAYEMVLMAFQKGDIAEVRALLAPEVADSFDAAIAERKERGLKIEAQFAGLREVVLDDARFDTASGEAQLDVRFAADLVVTVRDGDGAVVGTPDAMQPQRDNWTFARRMGSENPNWTLAAIGG